MVDLPGARRPDDGERPSRRHAEGNAFQDFAVRPVAEAHVVEDEFARARAELGGARRVLHLLRLAHEAEHLLHVGEALLDLAVGEAEEVQRHVELDEIGVHQHEVAHRHASRGDALRREAHHHRQADRDDRGLPGVQEVQGRFRPGVGPLVARQRGVVAPLLMRLVAEVLHRLVVQQAVDGLGVGVLVGRVHLPPEAQAPVGEEQGEGDVDADGGERDRGEGQVEHPPEDRRHQQDLDDAWGRW